MTADAAPEFADHRAFLASLSQEERAALTQTSDASGVARLAVHLGLIALLGALIWIKVPLWPLLMLPQGVLIIFLFTLLHETVHRTPFRTGWLNDAAGRIASFLIVLPADHFRYFHLAHHRYTQDPERDPELAGAWPTTWRAYLWRVSGLPTWGEHFLGLFRNALGLCRDLYVPPSGQPKVRREAQAMLAGYLVVAGGAFAFGWVEVLWVWVVPALLGQPFLRLYLMAEHGRCAFVSNMLENTRTTFTNRLVRWVAWNMPYHTEHHAFPAAPFHQLPRLHEKMRPHLRETERGYRRFHAKTTAALSS